MQKKSKDPKMNHVTQSNDDIQKAIALLETTGQYQITQQDLG
jgi:hypothetical protein